MSWGVLLLAAAASAVEWQPSLPAALEAAKARNQPVLVDFDAPWCYSCYYMEQHVLSKPRFGEASARLVAARVDVDTPEGRALKAKHAVNFLPTYLVLGPGGKPLGRIVGEQTESDFHAQLEKILRGEAIKSARDALRAKLKKGDVGALESLLSGEPSCETPYDVFDAEKPVERLYPEHRELVLNREKAALERLAETRLFSSGEPCADFRSGVEALAAVYQKLGDGGRREALLARAVEFLEAKALKPGEDRNHDDNLRHFLEKAGRAERLRAHFEALVAAYPSDYVYAYRFAKWLDGAGRPAEALPWIEKADKLAYGGNRLTVTGARARILAALGRGPEARALIERDLKAAPKAFSGERESLLKVRAELPRKP